MSSAAPTVEDRLVIGNTIGEMDKVVEFVDDSARTHGIPQAAVNDLNVCLDELLNNTISYGYDDRAPHNISLTLRLAGDLLTSKYRTTASPLIRGDTPKPKVPEGTMQSRKVGGSGIISSRH